MAETVLNPQESKVETATEQNTLQIRLKSIVGFLLFLAMIGLTAFVLHLQNQNYNILSSSTQLALISSERATVNYRTYVDRYKETKVELDETTKKLEIVNQQLDQVTQELSNTKGLLTQTQGMLLSAQEENTKLKQELQGLDSLRTTNNVQNVSELQDKIKTLQDKDSQVSQELSDLKSQLRAFEADFATPQEGKSLISLFQSKIKLVKTRMNYLSQEAYRARVAAQKEKDRLATLNGNTGYLIRNGQLQNPDGTKKSFAIDVKIVQ